MRSLAFGVAVLVAFAIEAVAAPREERPVPMKLINARLPFNWNVVPDDGGITATPAKDAESEGLTVYECLASDAECRSTCDEATARNYLYFLEENRPPAQRQRVNRADGLFEYRANGRYGYSGAYVSALMLCGDAGLVFALSQSASRQRAAIYVRTFAKTIEWRK